MKKVLILLMLITVSYSACKTLKNKSDNMRKNPEIAIIDMIKMLKEKHYDQLFETYMDRETYNKFKNNNTFDNVLEKFKKNGKAEKLLLILENASNAKPVFEESGTVARYKQEDINAHKDLLLIKDGEYWYIKN